MIGLKLIAGVLLSVHVVNAAQSPHEVVENGLGKMVDQLRTRGFFQDGKVDIPVAKFCDIPYYLDKLGFFRSACVKITAIATAVHDLESAAFCGQVKCNATYDPLSGLCQCSWGSPDQMKEDSAWPDQECTKTTKCFAPFAAHWDPSLATCTCAVETFPRHFPLIRFEPDPIRDRIYGPSHADHKVASLHSLRLKMENDLAELKTLWETVLSSWMKFKSAYGRLTATVKDFERTHAEIAAKTTKIHKIKRTLSATVRQATSDAVSLAPLPTYIPPPNTNVTQELIQESLLLQPQQKAIVGSVIPHFADGIISFLVQLDGPISQTLTLNSTDTLPCEDIGLQPQPILMLVPKVVRNGTQETTLPDCLVIAVNMYSPNYITYWVQKDDGSVFSLLSDNNIHAIDQLDTSQSAAVAIRVASDNGNTKRDIHSNVDSVSYKRHHVYSIQCGDSCPFYHMDRVEGSDGYCGCMFEGAENVFDLAARGVEPVSPFTATMSAEACAAMSCINNGGKPPLFNPFTATCWCASPTYVEENANSYAGGL